VIYLITGLAPLILQQQPKFSINHIFSVIRLIFSIHCYFYLLLFALLMMKLLCWTNVIF